jgi:hypothetical protein
VPPNHHANQIAKAGLGLLKRLVYDESTLAPDERRQEERAPVAGEVDVRVIDDAGAELVRSRVFIRDLSKGGCGLWSRVAMPAGHRVVLTFPAAQGAAPMLKTGRIQHCRGQAGSGFAVGVRFLDVQPGA